MNEENKNAYSEVIEILKLIDDEKQLEALPMEMLELLKSKINPEYKPIISKDIPLDEQNLQPETFAILNWITQKYWNNEATEDNIIENVVENVSENEKVDNEESSINQEATIEDAQIEHHIDTSVEEHNIVNTNLPILHDSIKWYERIRIKIVKFFRKLFRRNKTKELQEGNDL